MCIQIYIIQYVCERERKKDEVGRKKREKQLVLHHKYYTLGWQSLLNYRTSTTNKHINRISQNCDNFVHFRKSPI